MQESAEICTLKNSHARQNNPTLLMISKRLVMVCVRQHCTGYAPAENGDWILFDLGDWVMLRVIGNCVRLFLVARLF